MNDDAVVRARIAVVGAGWAGLAAALSLAQTGLPVTVFEAAPMAGGRARTVELDTPLGRIAIDNGQHLVVGAYRETLALAERLGSGALLGRAPLSLTSPSGLRLRAARLPAPLHLGWALATARGLGPGGGRAMLRLMTGLRAAHWRSLPGETVERLLARFAQPAALVARLWSPLCIGALNTLPAEACATAFAAVLRDTLGADRGASDFVTTDAPLGSLLPEPALARLRALGADIRLRSAVRRIERRSDGWRLECHAPDAAANDVTRADARAAAAHGFDRVLLALPPWSAARLLEASGLAAGPISAFEPEPIATAWALWPAGSAPALPPWSLLDEAPARGRHGQWLFDRGVVAASGAATRRARVAGIVISVASRLDALSNDAIADGIASQLVEAFGGPPPAALRLVTERRATFRCTPGRPRLRPDFLATAAPGLWLAGDWLWPDYPATLEAAVRSGHDAARRMLAQPPAR